MRQLTSPVSLDELAIVLPCESGHAAYYTAISNWGGPGSIHELQGQTAHPVIFPGTRVWVQWSSWGYPKKPHLGWFQTSLLRVPGSAGSGESVTCTTNKHSSGCSLVSSTPGPHLTQTERCCSPAQATHHRPRLHVYCFQPQFLHVPSFSSLTKVTNRKLRMASEMIEVRPVIN